MIKHKNATNVQFLFELIYQCRINLKLRHWLVSKVNGSNVQHIALDQIVEELDEAIDTLIESYQGKYGLLQLNIEAIKSSQNANDTLEYLQTIVEKIESSKSIL